MISLLLPFLIAQVLWANSVSATEKKGPRISKHKLDNPPANLFYFDDSDTIIVHDREAGIVLRSEDAGESWKTAEDIEEGEAWDVQRHPFNNQVAYVLGRKHKHWITKDQGKSWTKFDTHATPSLFKQPLHFHATNSDKVLLHTQECSGVSCEEKDYYTTDSFESSEIILKDTKDCLFAHSTPHSQANKDEIPEDRVFCVVLGTVPAGVSHKPEDRRIVYSDDYFKSEPMEPYLEVDRTVKGIIKMAMVKDYLVAAAKDEKSAEMALYVTKDASKWHRALFPKDHKLEEDAYTILESTNYSIQVDVMTGKTHNPMGVLFTSNSNGTYFTRNIQHTNRNNDGNVDFEKVQGIQGIVLVNVVDNWEEVALSVKAQKKLITKISFDDGRTFKPVKCNGEDLHLHSVTDVSNFFGRIYSSRAPGIVMGVGNTGDFLKEYEQGDLYVSDDAGLTWNLAIKEAHKYEFGDQGAVLVAIYDEGPTEKISYSLNHGRDWETADLGDKVRAKVLTTTPDSTSLKFLLVGTIDSKEFYIFSIDFNGLHEKKCQEEDFEDWFARLDEEGNPDCLMGRQQWYRRRKADADCFVDQEFKDPVPQFKDCTCTKEDFECDYNFVKDEENQKCVPAGVMPVPEGQCKEPGDMYTGSSGWRLIPGNNCQRKDGVELDKVVERPCKESAKDPVSGKPSHEQKIFQGKSFLEHYYLERGDKSTGNDQTVIMRTSEKEIYISRDHGKTWTQVLKGEEIAAIYPHQYNNDIVYFLTRGTTVHYTINRGDTFDQFPAPHEPTRDKEVQIMGFHADVKDWLLWTGAVGCSTSDENDCHSVISYSTDRGDDWKTLLRYVRKCEFIKKEARGNDEKLDKLVYCEQFKDEKLDSPLQLISSNNWFAESKVHFGDVIKFATMSEYIIVAAKDRDQKSLKIDTSMDGMIFADAMFPPNFKVPHQTAYTVLDSSTHAVFLHVTVENREGFEYGSIVKSNSNGTSYVLSINGVNRNQEGYADFEKMQGLRGVALVNVVENLTPASDGESKKLKSMITHNDGAQWAPLQAPKKNKDGKDYDCDVENVEECSLHLHGYTEREDPRNTFSSPSAIGLMLGVGNVGKYLTRKAKGDLFITSDGGVNWRMAMKGNYIWDYGDQGSIIVIVKEREVTNKVHYTRDEGSSWIDYEFSEENMVIIAITTVPSDTSRNFLLWGKNPNDNDKIVTINLDFTGLTDRRCELSLHDLSSKKADYYLWKPKHPLQNDDCLFGQETEYLRKKPESDCYNGPKIPDPVVARTCECTRRDFEWYVNFFISFFVYKDAKLDV